MILTILGWILGISIALLGIIAIFIIKVIWLILPWLILVVFIGAVVASGVKDLANKNKAP